MNNRLLIIKNELKKQKLDAVLVSSVPNITYLTSFSGFSKKEREALVLLTPNKQYILTDKRYRDELQDVISNPDSIGAKNLTFELEEVSSSIPYRLALEKLIKKHKIKKLGIEVDNLTVAEYITLKKIFKTKSSLVSFSISENRAAKEQEEIDAIEKACNLTDKTFDYILTKIKPGITEKDLAFEIEFFIKKNGGELAFPSIVAFGKNSAIPHHKSKDQRLKTIDCILLDFGAKVDDYRSDMTRVVFLGKASDEQKKVYQTVLEAQKRAIEYINNVILRSPTQRDDVRISSVLQKPQEIPRSARNDIMASDADEAAHDYIREQGFGENIFHSLGHGVGLEIHEAPRLSPKSKETLKPGMVFTIEPGIYLPQKFGVRIEDSVVLEKTGLRLLTHSPKTLIEL